MQLFHIDCQNQASTSPLEAERVHPSGHVLWLCYLFLLLACSSTIVTEIVRLVQICLALKFVARERHGSGKHQSCSNSEAAIVAALYRLAGLYTQASTSLLDCCIAGDRVVRHAEKRRSTAGMGGMETLQLAPAYNSLLGTSS